ncbi:uncharacterized protein LOC141647321 isoform X2 [Silene latifolia]|uniref:uncharacterized protein LOC141647321 isoform X2 n=1 Tax=Silene latifolia TaxID=37657 RepID=UPI003D76AD9F
MADNNEDDDEGFTFGDFVFAHPQPPPPPINGVSLSPHNVHPFISNSNPAHPSHNRVDPDPFVFSKPKGALPLSLFGQIEVEDNDFDVAKSGKIDHLLNYGFNFNYNNNNTNGGKSNGGVDPNLEIVSGNGSSLNFINGGDHGDDDDDDGDDDWEFMDAVSGNGDVVQQNIQGNGGSGVISGVGVEKVVVVPLEHQNASNSTELKPGFGGFSIQPDDLFAAFPKDMNKSSEKDVMFDGFLGAGDIGNRSVSASNSIKHKSGSSSSLPQSNYVFVDSLVAGNRSSEIDVGLSNGVRTNGFTWDAFSGSEKIVNGGEISGTSEISVEHEPRSRSVFPHFDNLFAAPLKADNKSSETDFEFKPTTVTISSLGFDAFPEVKEIHNRSTLSATSSSSAEQKPDSSSFLFPSNNLFEVTQGAVNESSEMFAGFKNTSSISNGFMFDAFPEVESGGNEKELSAAMAASTANSDDDFDDFGDFIDASQEVKTGEQDKPSLRLNSKEALPLSLFGDSTEETSETLNHSNELFHKQTSNPGNGFSGQGSVVSIHDLITNLYSQAQSIQSVGSKVELAEDGVHNIQEKESPSLDEDDEWDSNFWEFKGSFREAGVEEQPSSAIPGSVAQIQLEVSQNVQDYIHLYTALRNSLCSLLSCQVDELQKARCLDTENCIAEVPETLDNEIQNARKLLKEGVVSHSVSEKYLDKSSCLNEVVKILEEPKFKIIESEFSVSKKLELAANDWRVTADLLRHAISILKSLSLGSADEQCCYASTWSNIIGVCAQELRSGAVIWKRASEMKVKHQVLLDSRGQNHIQALGEIYKAVELLGLSAKVYKAWMLFSVSDSSRFVGLLNECRDLWSSSGLEETLQSLSDYIGDGCDEPAKALLASIKNIRDFDVLPVYECVFGQPKSICELSLLPQEMLPELETVTWNGAPYFLRLANLWANLISFEPPQLPHVQVN